MNSDKKLANKKNTGIGSGIKIIKSVAFAFAIVSWKATADGLGKYVFTSSGWQTGLISFGIQALLFVFNLQLPLHLAKIGEHSPERKKRKYYFGSKRGCEKKSYKITAFQSVIIGCYLLFLCVSSGFSFVYICDSVVYKHQSGYVDDNTVLTASYRKTLSDTYNYITEGNKAMQILASKYLGKLSEEYPNESEENQGSSKQDLMNIVQESQDAYNIAEEEYNMARDTVETYKSEMDSYAISRSTTTWHERQDEWEKKHESAKADWEEAQKNLIDKKEAYESAKSMLHIAQNNLANYKDSQGKIISDFLTEILKVNPDKKVLEEYITKLNDRMIELGTENTMIENYGKLMETTQTLVVIVKDYINLVEAESDETTGIDVMMKHMSDKITIPDPDSKEFETEYSEWKTVWSSKISNLENVIQQLPEFSESEIRQLKSTIVDTKLLENYNVNEKINILDDVRRSKVSDINIIEKIWALLWGKYRFIAWFSLGLAIFFDIASLLAGLFIYGISNRKKEV